MDSCSRRGKNNNKCARYYRKFFKRNISPVYTNRSLLHELVVLSVLPSPVGEHPLEQLPNIRMLSLFLELSIFQQTLHKTPLLLIFDGITKKFMLLNKSFRYAFIYTADVSLKTRPGALYVNVQLSE